MKSLLSVLIGLVVLSACAPSSEKVAAAIAATMEMQTQTALAQYTPTPLNTPTPTNTPEPTITPTATPDLRVVDGVPLDFALKSEDLPKAAKYYLPDSSWTGRHSNNEVIGGWGVDQGRVYLERTKRVDSWWVELYRASQVLVAPQYVYCNVVEYETTEGAQISLLEYNVIAAPYRSNVEFELAKEEFPDLGDTRIAYYYEYMHDSGVTWIQYNLEATYYNYLVACAGTGRKVDVEPEFMGKIVDTMLNKLKSAPLVSP